MTMTAPASTGIGAPGTQPAPANLGRSPMASQPQAQGQSAIPFTRGSTDATMKDAQVSLAFSTTSQVQLQTNAFLAFLVMEVTVTATNGSSASVAYNADAPWNVINQIKFDDPAGQSIITPISGYGLYLLNKYLADTECGFDPRQDPIYSAPIGTSSSGSFTFRVIVPVEIRHRDAYGALNNSAANQRYLLTITTGATADVYSTAPSTAPTAVAINFYQGYWTSPPSTIVTSQGTSQVQATPSGLGTVAFVRYERHNEVSGGGSPQIQLNNVGDYISCLIFVLRNSSNARIQSSGWPPEFDWWVNDFQVHALSLTDWQRNMGRFYGYTATTFDSAGGLDTGVFVLYQLNGVFDRRDNFAPPWQYLPTDATTKLQIRGSTWGASSSYLEVYTRMVRPVNGQSLFT